MLLATCLPHYGKLCLLKLKARVLPFSPLVSYPAIAVKNEKESPMDVSPLVEMRALTPPSYTDCHKVIASVTT